MVRIQMRDAGQCGMGDGPFTDLRSTPGAVASWTAGERSQLLINS